MLKDDNYDVEEMWNGGKLHIENKICKLKTERKLKSTRTKLKIQRDKHDISTIKANKIALRINGDIKRKILNCRKTLAYGTSKELLDKNGKINKKKIWRSYNCWLISMT